MLFFLQNKPFVVGKFESVVSFLIQSLHHRKSSQVILPCSLHDLSLSEKSQLYEQIDFCTTDSMWLTWFLKFKTSQKIERVYGPDLMTAILNLELEKKSIQKHYFLAADQKTASKLKTWIEFNYSPLKFEIDVLPHQIPASKEQNYLRKIVQSESKVVWLGIGSPKQLELANWLKIHSTGLKIFCVGAAFDFVSGHKQQAPVLMRYLGLEWLFRLCSEPRRLWHRYLVIIPRYLVSTLFKKL